MFNNDIRKIPINGYEKNRILVVPLRVAKHHVLNSDTFSHITKD